MSFDWQTEENKGDWEALDIAASVSEKEPGGKRPFWRWLILFGLLLVALIAAGWTVNQRLRLATEQVEADILASHELVAEAVSGQDDELFQNLLSGRDDAWGGAMTTAVAEGTLTERWGLGLYSLPVTELVIPTIEVAANLLEAEVTVVMPYAIEIGNGLTETVDLAQTAVYRQGANHWLLSPPDDDFWGGTRQIEGQYVTLFYPERDKEIAQALLLNLDGKIGQLCIQIQDVECPDGYRFIVELDTDPTALANLYLSSAIAEAQARHLIWPTPTLVGLPVDRTGENALLRGYGQLLVGAVLTDLLEYECCGSDLPVYIELLHVYFRQLGLALGTGMGETAVAIEEFDALLAAGSPKLFERQSLWNETIETYDMLPESRPAALVAFAQEELGLTGRDLMQSIDMLRDDQPYGDWLRMVSRTSLSASELESAWLSFVYNNTSYAQQEPPVPFPEQDIQLLCQIGDQERMAFYRYNLAENETILDQSLNRFVENMVALPNDDGLAVWENEDEASLTQMFLWADGQKLEISWDAVENAPSPVPLHLDPTNSKLILAPSQYDQMNYGLLDVASCLDDACQLETLVGYPIWAPDMAHMILLDGTMVPPHEAHAIGQLTLANDEGQAIRPLGLGLSPFWLDSEQFGFVFEDGEAYRHMIVTGRIDDLDGQDKDILLTVAELTAVIGDGQTRLFSFVSLHPQDPEQLVIVAIGVDTNEQTVFIYDWVEGEVISSHSYFAEWGRNQSYRFSPNGRFLLMSQYEFEAEQQNSLFITDLVEGETSQLTLEPNPDSSVHWVTDFSQDGEWLLVSDDNMLTLLLPGTDYERLIFPETGACKTAVWVNKNS